MLGNGLLCSGISMVKVTIDRENCTSCGSCWDLCPEFFEENPADHFSQIIEDCRAGGNPAEGEAPEDAEACVRDAADACPVTVITVDEETP
jgi:ferredoxin